jgi:hypothetical protein
MRDNVRAAISISKLCDSEELIRPAGLRWIFGVTEPLQKCLGALRRNFGQEEIALAVTGIEAASKAGAKSSGKLGLVALVALVVGSMIGGGVFSLPQNMAKGASPGAVVIGWLITGIGMLALAFVYQSLSTRKPALDAGPYAYARAGFGDFVGFNSAWGYWLSAWLGNV